MATDRLDYLGDQLTDHCTEALVEVISAKAEHRTPQPGAEAHQSAGQAVDLMAALEKSIAEARERRGKTGPADRAEATVHEMPKPRRAAFAYTGARSGLGRPST
ncbi:hypothetical protein [Streptomyces exfoliatus]|uniref:hypothetical protein n=1 Tax=Streptomyces exfoliatus TaxID=1905 RepID=UPI003C2E2C9B